MFVTPDSAGSLYTNLIKDLTLKGSQMGGYCFSLLKAK